MTERKAERKNGGKKKEEIHKERREEGTAKGEEGS